MKFAKLEFDFCWLVVSKKRLHFFGGLTTGLATFHALLVVEGYGHDRIVHDESTEVRNTRKTHHRVILHCKLLGSTSSGSSFCLHSLNQNNLAGCICRATVT